ncbi:Dak1 domain-containing protein [Roridomyces roridus]|uniref:Dak1 domain-containing protein n=1 Tax=Roridomyces roridus TaxID=1738132 RepID=A0AAD7C7V8_9AGAR|nr:Dak1 domain-containing protein [Roridomyces roridus]
MTDRHVFSDHTTLVVKSLQGLVASQPNLSLIPSIKTVFDAAHDESKVSLICGGGAGHEPGSTGFVGRGLLSASVSGDTFASPSARQVSGAIKAVPSTEGTLLIITNYTGDNLHFGLACQQARANGLEKIAILPVGDDVSVGRTKGALVGRRAMAGTILVCKILGAAAEASWSFEEVQKLGRGVTSAIASIGCTLGHCHVPGRADYALIPEDTVEIGLGLHNEPGVWVVKPQPSSTELIARMLKLILDKDDPERAFVPFDAQDEVVLLVNNMGGMSVLEMYAIVDETLVQLKQAGLVPTRVFCGPFMTSLNAPGFSLTLLNLTHIAKSVSSVEELIKFVDAPHASAAWPSKSVYPTPTHLEKRAREEKFIEICVTEHKLAKSGGPTLKVDPAVLVGAMRAGAAAVLKAEPDLTRWDTIVGDGDCGETCAAGAQAVLSALDNGLGSDGEVVNLLRLLTELIDDTCGGTLGAIFSIFLASLTTEVRTLAATTSTADLAFWGKAGNRAIGTLKLSTAARVGHRTVMDALIPFVEALETASDFEAAVEACRAGGEGTAKLVAKLGRATYVGDNGNLPPDPGAMCLVFLTKGMGDVLKK